MGHGGELRGRGGEGLCSWALTRLRLDEKGRLFLPAKYREELAGGLVITKGQERCLYVFPAAEFGRITDELRTAPVTAKAVRDYRRVLLRQRVRRDPRQAGPDHHPAGPA